MAFREMSIRQEADSVITALMETYAAGERTPDVGGTLSTEEFMNRISHI